MTLQVGGELGQRRRIVNMRAQFSVATQRRTTQGRERLQVRNTQSQVSALGPRGDGFGVQHKQAMVGGELQGALGIIQAHGSVQRQPGIRKQLRGRPRNLQPVDAGLQCHRALVALNLRIQRCESGSARCFQLLDDQAPVSGGLGKGTRESDLAD